MNLFNKIFGKKEIPDELLSPEELENKYRKEMSERAKENDKIWAEGSVGDERHEMYRSGRR